MTCDFARKNPASAKQADLLPPIWSMLPPWCFWEILTGNAPPFVSLGEQERLNSSAVHLTVVASRNLRARMFPHRGQICERNSSLPDAENDRSLHGTATHFRNKPVMTSSKTPKIEKRIRRRRRHPC